MPAKQKFEIFVVAVVEFVHDFYQHTYKPMRSCRQALCRYLILIVTVCAVYCEPFLYTVHYNAVQVMHIASGGGCFNTLP